MREANKRGRPKTRDYTSMKTQHWIGVLVVVAIAALAGRADAQKLYKWVDKDGNVHYSDQVPPEDIEQARERMNEQGVVVDRVDRAKTDEEFAAEEAARIAAEEAAAAAERQRIEDGKILATYASEADITRIRDQRIDTLDRQIQSSQAFIGGQTQSLARLMERAAELESRGVEVSAALTDSIEGIRTQIRDQEKIIAAKEAEKATIDAEYEQELERFREVARRRLGQASEG